MWLGPRYSDFCGLVTLYNAMLNLLREASPFSLCLLSQRPPSSKFLDSQCYHYIHLKLKRGSVSDKASFFLCMPLRSGDSVLSCSSCEHMVTPPRASQANTMLGSMVRCSHGRLTWRGLTHGASVSIGKYSRYNKSCFSFRNKTKQNL